VWSVRFMNKVWLRGALLHNVVLHAFKPN